MQLLSIYTVSKQDITIQVVEPTINGVKQKKEVYFLITDDTGYEERQIHASISIQTLKDLLPEFQAIIEEDLQTNKDE